MQTRDRKLAITLTALLAGLLFTIGAQAETTTSASGTVAGTVTVDGQPAVNAKVLVFKGRERRKGGAGGGAAGGPAGGGAATGAADGADGKKTRPQPLMTSTTDGDGKFTLSLPAGEYVIVAGEKGEGRGHERVSVVEGQTATVAITLEKKAATKPVGNT